MILGVVVMALCCGGGLGYATRDVVEWAKAKRRREVCRWCDRPRTHPKWPLCDRCSKADEAGEMLW
jgi:hypothetical protein